MMYGKYKILLNETTNQFGYRAEDLPEHSSKPVVVQCIECGFRVNKALKYVGRNHVCSTVRDGKKRCCVCKKWLLLDDFSKNRSAKDGRSKLCKDCFSQQPSVVKGYRIKNLKTKNELKYFLTLLLCKLRTKSLKQNVPFDLDADFLENLFKKGICYYTNQEVRRYKGVSSPDSASVDRLCPQKGYTKNNVVLCSFAINSLKGSMDEQEFKAYLNKTLPFLANYCGV